MQQSTAFLSILLFACLSVFSQNLGINNTDPRVSIDITGGLAHRAVTLNPVANMLNLPANISFVIIGNTGVTGPVTLTDPDPPINGRRLVLLNNSGFTATLGNFSIADGTIREFVCSGPGGGWHLLTPSFSTNPSWLTTGNFGTDTAINFLGTMDDMELAFRTNNLERMRLTNDGLKIRGELRLELGYGIENKPWGNGTIFYNQLGNNPTLDIYGAGNDFTGYDRRITFWAQGGASFIGGASFNGSVSINGEIKPGGNEGQAGQVLTSIGAGQMKWDFPEKTGQILQLSPYSADTTGLAEQGYQFMGIQNHTVSKTTPNGGTISFLVDNRQIKYDSHLFHFPAQNKIFVVGENTISSISLADATYGAVTNHTVPAFNLNNTTPVFSGTKIFIYPFFIFDCATNTTSPFPTAPCGGIVSSTAQAWTGTFLVMYGPGGGIRYNPATNAITCIETMVGNLYKPNSTATAAGTRVMFYGGYVLALGDTISFDGGLLYDPVSNSWNDVAAGGPRIHSHQAVWTGTEVMFFGGRTDEARSETGINFYNPNTSSWNTGYTPGIAVISTDKNTRSHFVNNKVFVYNLIDLDRGLPVTFENRFFNLSTKTWNGASPGFKNIGGRNLASSVVVGSEIFFFPYNNDCQRFDFDKLHFFAQESNTGYVYPKFNLNLNIPYEPPYIIKNMASSSQYILSFGMHGGGLNYQINRNRWTRTATVNQPTDREGHVCISIGNNSFFVWGGKNGTTYLNNGAIYNAATNTWTTVSATNAPSARSGHTAAFGNGKILVWGGNAGGAFLNNGKLYDITSNTWTNVSTAGAPACSTFVHLDWSSTEFRAYCNGVYGYNPVGNTWEFRYFPGASNYLSSSSEKFNVNVSISTPTYTIYQKEANLHYTIGDGGSIRAFHPTQFLNDKDIFIPGFDRAVLFDAASKEFKFMNFDYNYLPMEIKHPILHPAAINGEFVIMGVNFDFNCEATVRVFKLNSGPPVTRDINVQSLFYRKD